MSRVSDIHEDLHYVREVVARREKQQRSAPDWVYYIWALYTVIGYTLIDLAPRVSSVFFLTGFVICSVLSGMLARRAAQRSGEWDPVLRRQRTLHWLGGVSLAIVATVALCSAIPPLREKTYSGQVCVVLIGIVYYLAGVHFERLFLWLGPVLIAGGVVVGIVPHYGWTLLGVVIALGLVAPTFFRPRRTASV